MKPHTFLLLLVTVLSCRAETPAAVPATPPAEAAKAAAVAPAATQPVTASLDSNKSNLMLAMTPVVVSGSSDLKPSAPDLGKSLADMRAEQKASMNRQLVDETQSRKAAFAGALTLERPALAAPKLAPGTSALALPPLTEGKSLAADASRSK